MLGENDAWLLELNPGQHILASRPHQALVWIQRHVPDGPDKDRWLEYYSYLDYPSYVEMITAKHKAIADEWEKREIAERQHYWEWLQKQQEQQEQYRISELAEHTEDVEAPSIDDIVSSGNEDEGTSHATD
jgi:hypothetical protein